MPVLSLAALDRGETIGALHQACAGAGFFHLVEHGVPGGVIAGGEAQMQALFGLPTGAVDGGGVGELGVQPRV